jgi:hypothetical protein
MAFRDSHQSPPELQKNMLESGEDSNKIFSHEQLERKSRRHFFDEKYQKDVNFGIEKNESSPSMKQTSRFIKPEGISKDLFNSKGAKTVSEFTKQKFVSVHYEQFEEDKTEFEQLEESFDRDKI